MTATKLYDLEIEIKSSDGIWLTQSVGCGEDATIVIHPVHIRHLAELTGLLECPKPPAMPHGLKKRLERILEGLEASYDDLKAIPTFPPGSGEDDPATRDLLQVIEGLQDTLDDYWPQDQGETPLNVPVDA